ncbi:MAG TPA: hypothetical protein VLB46_02885 [Pyrinomonadaceae bacterium]|nr:hypothetical protein [Pyrinomonadaceae bacterium]
MPARWLKRGRRILTLIAVGVLVPAAVKAQSAVTLKATVTETVSLSVLPNSIDAEVVSIGNTVRVTLSSAGSPVVRVPLLVRSNTSFNISAVVESTTAELAEVSIADVRATGTLVAPNAITALNAPSNPLDLSRPFLVATGPRVSLGGTLNSPNNALQITVLIRFKPVAEDWTAQLNLIAAK